MRLSRKSDYAVRAVRYLATLPEGGRGSISTIAEGEAIPREFLAKILKDLTQAKILKAYKGVSGGYQLSKPPTKITFLEVIEAIDGPIKLSLCTDTRASNLHRRAANDELCKFWKAQEQKIVKTLKSQTFGKFRGKTKR